MSASVCSKAKVCVASAGPKFAPGVGSEDDKGTRVFVSANNLHKETYGVGHTGNSTSSDHSFDSCEASSPSLDLSPAVTEPTTMDLIKLPPTTMALFSSRKYGTKG